MSVLSAKGRKEIEKFARGVSNHCETRLLNIMPVWRMSATCNLMRASPDAAAAANTIVGLCGPPTESDGHESHRI